MKIEFKAKLVFVNECTGEVVREDSVYTRTLNIQEAKKEFDKMVIEFMADYYNFEGEIK